MTFRINPSIFSNLIARWTLIGLAIGAVGCNSEFVPDPIGPTSKPAIWCEVIEEDSSLTATAVVAIALNKPQTDSTTIGLTPREVGFIALTDHSGIARYLHFADGRFTASSLKPFADSCFMNLRIGELYFLAAAERPADLHIDRLTIVRTAVTDTTEQLRCSLSLSATANCHAVIDLVTTRRDGSQYRETFTTIGGNNLNNRFRELGYAATSIFVALDAANPSMQQFATLRTVTKGERLELRLRAISQAYFDLLYRIEVQRDEHLGGSVNPAGNIVGALGGFGYIRQQRMLIQ